ncbi:hypothetical protein JZ751_013525 [Albula glossodonta]|uniref:Uncharacterized protein n=1 Tax=Albula glossodonta TaxID=121402 RepID=A0A8T2MJF6_9TELE|nr:hypothetical protein JZ751_013525 [Albula glossodonta]
MRKYWNLHNSVIYFSALTTSGQLSSHPELVESEEVEDSSQQITGREQRTSKQWGHLLTLTLTEISIEDTQLQRKSQEKHPALGLHPYTAPPLMAAHWISPRRTCPPLTHQHQLSTRLQDLPHHLGKLIPTHWESHTHHWRFQGGLPQDSTNSLLVSSFEDKTIRRAFIRKVFSVVTLQLLVTFSVVCVFTFSGAVRDAVQGNIWVYISSYIIFIVVAVCLNFSSTLSRKHPWNLVALAVVTLSLSYMVGTAASYHSTTAVVIAMGATMVISFIIIIFSAQTRVDFTVCNGILLVLSVDLLMFGLLCCFYYTNVLQVVYGCLGALLYSLFLAVDCQLVMGRQTYALSPEEYVFASLILYLDIITIFLYLLILLGGSSSN